MSEQLPVTASNAQAHALEPFDWLGRVLTQFAVGERAIGQLCIKLGLSIEKGPLSSLNTLYSRLSRSSDKRARTLLRRIERWQSCRPQRHLLAHASIMVVHDIAGNRFFLTRHVPRDRDDVTPDRLWTEDECRELLRIATNDGRSIADQIRNLTLNPAAMQELAKPDLKSSQG